MTKKVNRKQIPRKKVLRFICVVDFDFFWNLQLNRNYEHLSKSATIYYIKMVYIYIECHCSTEVLKSTARCWECAANNGKKCKRTTKPNKYNFMNIVWICVALTIILNFVHRKIKNGYKEKQEESVCVCGANDSVIVWSFEFEGKKCNNKRKVSEREKKGKKIHIVFLLL